MSLPKYSAYRASGVEWLGELPAHWNTLRLKYTCDVLPSNVDKKSYEGEAPVWLCNYTDVYYNESITPGMPFMEASASPEQIAKFTLRAGDTVITKDSETADDIAIAAHVPLDLPGVVCGYHLAIVRPTTSVDGRFIKRLFDCRYLRSKFETLANGLTRVGLSQDALANVVVPLPPADEQSAIATFLDRETAKIDTLIAEQEKLIALLAEKRQATISHAVTRGLDPDVPMKDSGVPWLGEVPAHWRVVPLRYCIDYQEGPGILAADFQDSGVPLLRVACVQQRVATLEGCNHLDPAKVEARWAHFRVARGDLLISASASMGTVCEVEADTAGAVPYTGLIRLRGVPGGMRKDFIRHCVVSSSFLAQIDLLKAGATIQHFGPTHLGQMRAALPPDTEQLEIAAHIDSKLKAFDELSEAAAHAAAVLRERRSALITAAVTGQIDVRGLVADTASRPVDREPASA